MNLSDQQAYFAAVRSDLKVFLQQAFHTVYPGKEFMDNWHIDAIVQCLEQAIRGEMPRLIINLPPRNLKSFIASVALPAFMLGLDPSAKVICVSYSDELAKTLSRDFKRIVESEWYRKVFPNVKLTKATEGEVATDVGGFRYATSVGGTLTGRGGDFIIVDDPIKPEDAYSDKARNGVNDWYRSTLLSRLDDKKRSVFILVMQRVHVNDLTGFVEAVGGFHKLSFPAIATKNEVIDLRNGDQYRREVDEPLHQEREDSELLMRMRDDVGDFNFASQYQQSPATPDGALFKRKWFKLIEEGPMIDPRGALYVSIDAGSSTADTADYTAISLIYVYKGIYYVLFAERGRWDYETLKGKVLSYLSRFGKAVTFIVESAGAGVSLLGYLRAERIACFHYLPRPDKQTRAAYTVPVFAEGRVHVLNKSGQNDWVEPYINEFVNFPHGRFDDQVDSLVQLVVSAKRLGHPGGRFTAI